MRGQLPSHLQRLAVLMGSSFGGSSCTGDFGANFFFAGSLCTGSESAIMPNVSFQYIFNDGCKVDGIIKVNEFIYAGLIDKRHQKREQS